MSLWLNLGQLATRAGGLLPSFANLTSWLQIFTADGKTLANSKGTDATLTAVNCLSFDGANDYVEFNHTLVDQQDFVVEWEGVMGAVSNNDAFWSLFDDSASNAGSYIRYEHTNTRFLARIGSSTITSSSITLAENDVVKLTTTISNSGTKASAVVVVNGVTTNLFTNQTLNTVPEFDGTGRIGRLSPLSSSIFAGKINSFKITQGEVNVHFPLAEGSGTKVYDVSGNGNHGTINGATWSTLDGIESWNHEYGFDSSIIDSGNFMTVPVTLTNMQEVASGEVGVRKFTKTAATSNNAFVTFGSYPSLSDGDSYSIKYTIKTDSDSGGSNITWGGQIIASSRATGNNNTYTTIDISATSPDKPSSGNNSYWGIAGKNFSGGDYTPNTNGIGIFTYTNHLEQGESLFIKDMTLDIATKIPALNTKTKQVATFDGVADSFATEPVTLGNNFEFEWTGSISNTESYGTILGNKSSTNTEGNFTIERVAQSGAINIVFYPNGGTRQISHSQSVDFFDGSVKTHKVTVNNGALTYVVDNVTIYTNTFPAGNGFTDNSSIGIYGKPNGTSNCGGTLQNFKLTISGSTAFEYDFQNDIGTTTVQDLSTNDNDGTVTVGAGGLDSFWGQRVADASGSLVSADYATGNTSISNPLGFVHNNSECGVDLVPTSITVSGAGTSSVNGTYTVYTGSITHLTVKANTLVYNKGYFLYQQPNGQWRISTNNDEDNHYYRNTATTDLPPTSGWTDTGEGVAPSPTLSYSNSYTAAQLFAIDNSTATQTFIRKDNGNIVQILDYSAALTGSDLTRTRNYVG